MEMFFRGYFTMIREKREREKAGLPGQKLKKAKFAQKQFRKGRILKNEKAK